MTRESGSIPPATGPDDSASHRKLPRKTVGFPGVLIQLEETQRLLNFKSLVLAPPNIRSFLRFLPDFWLNTTVFLHIRF